MTILACKSAVNSSGSCQGGVDAVLRCWVTSSCCLPLAAPMQGFLNIELPKLEGPINRCSPGANYLLCVYIIPVTLPLDCFASIKCRVAHAFMYGHHSPRMSHVHILQVSTCSPGVELALSRRGKTPTPAIMLIPKKNRKEVYKYLFKGEELRRCL